MIFAVSFQLTFALLNGSHSLELLPLHGDQGLHSLDTALDPEDLILFGEPLRDEG
jgi:hypothetical protein